MGKSVIVVEKKGRMGGHTETYIHPATQTSIDVGVQVFHDIDVVKAYFTRFNISLEKIVSSSATPQYVDFPTGKLVTGYTPTNATAVGNAIGAYTAQVQKYPALNDGFFLPDPVPQDLYLPFGEFIKKYSLDAAVYTIFQFSQAEGDMLSLPTLDIIKVLGIEFLHSLQGGFLATARHDNSELYEKAQSELSNSSSILLNSTVVASDRSDPSGCVKILVNTPNGRKLIRAKKLIITIPPTLYNLEPFDIIDLERDLFSQFYNVGYYTSLVRHDGISDNISVQNVGADTAYNLPVLPAIYSIEQTRVPGLHMIIYGSIDMMSDDEVKNDIIAAINRIRKAGTDNTTTPEFAVFSGHTPYNMMVSGEAIKNGFYKDLYALQGQRNTFWTGAAFKAHDSSMCWVYTNSILPAIAASL